MNKWDYWLSLYIKQYCVSRGLSSKTMEAYQQTLHIFSKFVKDRLEGRQPDELKTRDIILYINYLREERGNGPSAVQRQMAVLKGFYKAMVAYAEINPGQNPVSVLPKLKGPPRKIPGALSEEEVKSMIKSCDLECKIGIRDRAILIVLYGTGMRASEVSQLTDNAIDFENSSIHVIGKGGHERSIPMNPKVREALLDYKNVRGSKGRTPFFFKSMRNNAMSRNAIYERVRKSAYRGNLIKRVSPHKLRHTFASHLIKNGESINTVRVLLGHANISSTQIYLHIAGEELRNATYRHPIKYLVERMEENMKGVELPFRQVKLMTG